MGVKCCTYNIGLLLPVAGELHQPLCQRVGYINGHGIMLPESDVGSLVYATHASLAQGMQEARHLIGAMESFLKSSLGADFLLDLTSADVAKIFFASTETRNASLQISSAFAFAVSQPITKRYNFPCRRLDCERSLGTCSNIFQAYGITGWCRELTG